MSNRETFDEQAAKNALQKAIQSIEKAVDDFRKMNSEVITSIGNTGEGLGGKAGAQGQSNFEAGAAESFENYQSSVKNYTERLDQVIRNYSSATSEVQNIYSNN